MTAQPVRLVTAGLLIGVPVLFNAFFALLGAAFDYPEILRRPADEVLRRFDAGGPGLIGLWYGFAMTAALFLPAALLLRRALPPADGAYLDLATPLAVMAALVQLLGLLRWPLLVPMLASAYVDPSTDAATRAATVVVFQAFHQYAGVAVGEHLGYLFTAGWTAVIAFALLGTRSFRPWLGWLGLVAAVAILVGMLEPAGVGSAGPINALGYALWSLWLLATGVTLLRRPVGTPETRTSSMPTPLTATGA
jgi:hypothetical protein